MAADPKTARVGGGGDGGEPGGDEPTALSRADSGGSGTRGPLASLLRPIGVAALLLGALLAAGIALPGLLARHVVPHFLYVPDFGPTPPTDPARHGLPGAEEVRLTTSDGVELHGWWVPAGGAGAGTGEGAEAGTGEASEAGTGDGDRGDARAGGPHRSAGCGTVLFLHGNAGSLAGRAFVARRLSEAGFDVLLVDYRGYGESGGEPSEEGLRRDARAARRHAVEERDTPPARLAVTGNSLGAAVAARLASREPSGAVVLTGAFPGVPELAAEAYGWLPDALFRGWPTNRFETLGPVGEIRAPVLVARGERDVLVPRRLTRAVYEAAGRGGAPAEWLEVPGAGHDDVWSAGPFWARLVPFLEQSLGCAGSAGRSDP